MKLSIIIILYLIFAVAYDQSLKKQTKKMKNLGSLIVLINLLSGITCILLIPLFKIKTPTNKYTYILLGLACIFYALNDRFDVAARKGLEASTQNMIKQLSNVFITFIGIIILKEKIVLKKILGALLILISNFLVFHNKKTTKKSKYIIYGILASIATTIALLIDVNTSNEFNLPLYVALTFIIPSLLILTFERINIKSIIKEYKTTNKTLLLATTVSGSLMLILKLYALRSGNITIVAPLCSLTVIMNVIIEYIFLNNKQNLGKKAIAALLIIIGIALIKI